MRTTLNPIDAITITGSLFRTGMLRFFKAPRVRGPVSPMSSPMSLSRLRAEWFPNIPRELMAGAVATFALIPEVIAFSFVAGVDPAVGLFASFIISIVIAFTGGRPAMISAAAGSVALVAAPLVHSHGLAYLLAAGVLAGLLQIVFGLLRLGALMRFV